MAELRRRTLFLSYAREDAEQAAAIVHLIEQLDGVCYRDQDDFALRAGEHWEKVRNEKIASAQDGLLLLITRSIFEDGPDSKPRIKPQIQAEIDVAKSLGKHVRALILDGRAFDKLTTWFSEVLTDLNEQFIDLEQQVGAWPDINETKIKEKLWGLVTDSDDLMNYITSKHNECRDWADAIIPKGREILIDDPEPADWDLQQVESGFFAVVAPGGEGKSVLVARWILDARGWLPIYLPLERLIKGVAAVADYLGTFNGNTLDLHIKNLRRMDRRIVLVVDALEHLLTGAASDSIATALRSVSASVPVVCTSRPALWSPNFQWVLPYSRTRRLDGIASKRFFKRNPAIPKSAGRLLSDALFINHFLGDRNRSLENVTQRQFVNEMLQSGTRSATPSTRVRTPADEEILEALASLQLEERSYEVSWPALIQRLEIVGNDSHATRKALESYAFLRHDVQGGKVRLRHDVLDAANCVRFLEQRQMLHEWFDGRFKPIDLQIAVTLIRLLADDHVVAMTSGTQSSFQTNFDRVLRMLDVKQLRPDGAAKAWHATWILEELLLADHSGLIARTILNTIAGKAINGLDKESLHSSIELNVVYSSCAPPARLTRECASSLVSLWRVFEQGEAPLAEDALRVFRTELDRSAYRFRVIEALEKYSSPEARDSFLHTANAELRADRALLLPLARALAPWASEPDVDACLRRIADSTNADPLAKREARRITAGATRGYRYTDLELQWGLSSYDRYNPNRYSDWSQIVKLADYMIRESKYSARDWSADTIASLADCLSHHMPPVQVRAAMALVSTKSPHAALALLLKLLEAPQEGRSELDVQFLGALRQSLIDLCARDEATRDGVVRALKACRAEIAVEHRDRVEAIDAVIELAASKSITEGASLVLSLSPALSYGPISQGDEYPIEPDAKPVISRASPIDVGPSLEPKFRIAVNGFQPSLVHTDWKVGRGFHLGLSSNLRDPSILRMRVGTYLAPLERSRRQPGLACVHAILVTNDDLIVAAKRAKSVIHPERWSVSFEEQITAQDVGKEHWSHAALCRGLWEEFGISVEADRMFEGLILEHDCLNLSILLGARLPMSFEDVRAAWETNGNKSEIEDVQSIRSGIEDLVSLHPLHPSSELRFNLLNAFMAGECKCS